MSDLAAALDIVGARCAIVERLLDGPQRYGDLQRDLGMGTNMLATGLRELEAAGVLHRLPLRHSTLAYALTERGLALRTAAIHLVAPGRLVSTLLAPHAGPHPQDHDLVTMGSTVQTTWKALRTRRRISIVMRGMPAVSLFPTHPQFPDESLIAGSPSG